MEIKKINFFLIIAISLLFISNIACKEDDSNLKNNSDYQGEVQVSHLAGPLGGGGFADGTGTSARFALPGHITSDGTNLYVADIFNHVIRKIAISTGLVTTLAGQAGSPGSTDGTGTSARFYSPVGITIDDDYLYVSEAGNNTIRKIVISTGVVTTLAGQAGTWGSTDGIGSTARFNSPMGITNDGTNIYIADTENHTIRKITISTGVVTTIAGQAGSPDSTDGTGTEARFDSPEGIVSDGGNLYVADTGNETIRKIDVLTSEVTTFAGQAGSNGSTDDTGTAARFFYPCQITSDGTNLYVADHENNLIRKIEISTAVVTTVAGMAEIAGSIDGTGTAARFCAPNGITNDGANLYVADSENNTIRKIVISTALVTTLAGQATSGSTDGTGTTARFNQPDGIATDGSNIYVADTRSHTIRKIVISTGEVTTIAGQAGTYGSTDGTGTAARFNEPKRITCDGINLFVSDRSNHTIRKIVISTGVVTTLAGLAGVEGWVDGIGSSARFDAPTGITNDGTNLYVTDRENNTIRKIVISTGVVTTLAGQAGISGSADGTGTSARFNRPNDITNDGTNLYVMDENNNAIRKIVIVSRDVTTFVSQSKGGITNDGSNLYVADGMNCIIRKYVISTGVGSTFAGQMGIAGSTDGSGTTSSFFIPWGIVCNGTNLYVTEMNNDIRKISW